MSVAELDLGSEHFLRYTSWAPDRDLNPQYAHLPDCDRIGAILRHRLGEGWHEGSLLFDCEQTREGWPGRGRWQVVSFDPLTLTPSVLCKCGDHGFITNGQWVAA